METNACLATPMRVPCDFLESSIGLRWCLHGVSKVPATSLSWAFQCASVSVHGMYLEHRWSFHERGMKSGEGHAIVAVDITNKINLRRQRARSVSVSQAGVAGFVHDIPGLQAGGAPKRGVSSHVRT